MVICTVCSDHGLNVAYNVSRGYWYRQFSTTPAKLRKAASSCDICMATTTVLDAYADWDWDDEITKMNIASKPGVAMVLWWLDKSEKAERNVQLYSPEGNNKPPSPGLSISFYFLSVPIHQMAFDLLSKSLSLVFAPMLR